MGQYTIRVFKSVLGYVDVKVIAENEDEAIEEAEEMAADMEMFFMEEDIDDAEILSIVNEDGVEE